MGSSLVFGSVFSQEFYKECLKSSNEFLIITDTNVQKLYGERLSSLFSAPLFAFKAGERYKTRATKEKIEDAILREAISNKATVLALGGGTVTDMAGYIAATYHRGLKLIMIPTTLLAMVDAAHGGKNGVNTKEGKNLIGTFYYPHLIAIDPSFLETLPRKEYLNGMAEVIKYRLIDDMALASSSDFILPSIETKYAVIASGERDKLNFGHTIGHAIELASHYSISHGEAIAMGMLLELELSPTISFEKRRHLYQQMKELGFSLTFPKKMEKEKAINALYHDKKREKETIQMTLFQELGNSYLEKTPIKHIEKLFDREALSAYYS